MSRLRLRSSSSLTLRSPPDNDALERIKTRPMIIPRPKTIKEKEDATRDYVGWVFISSSRDADFFVDCSTRA